MVDSVLLCLDMAEYREKVRTLLHRAQEIPSTNSERSREKRRVIKVRRDNNCPLSFVRIEIETESSHDVIYMVDRRQVCVYVLYKEQF